MDRDNLIQANRPRMKRKKAFPWFLKKRKQGFKLKKPKVENMKSKTCGDGVKKIKSEENEQEMRRVKIEKAPSENERSNSSQQSTSSGYLNELLGVMPKITFSARKKCYKLYLQRLLDIRKSYVEEDEVSRFERAGLFACSGCFKRFKYYCDFEEHLKRPVGQLVFRCQVCLSTFQTINLCQVALHSSEFHINEAGDHPSEISIELVAAAALDEAVEMNEVCPECRKEVACIITHLWSCQSDHPVLQCPCCYVFATRNVCRYNLHVRIHKFMAPYMCPDCAKVYEHFEDLAFHLQETCRHAEETVRYKCSLCGLVFKANEDVMRHTFADHNPVKYKCHLCPTVWNLTSEKNSHYDEKHFDELTEAALRRIKSYTLPHKCAICGEEGLRGFSYERHVRNHFSGPNYKFICFICECGYITMYKGGYLLHRSTPCITFDFSALKQSPARLKKCMYCSELKFYNGVDPFVCEPCESFERASDWCYKCTICFDVIRYSMDCVIIHLHNAHSKDVQTPYCYVEKVPYDPINSSAIDMQNSINCPHPSEGPVIKEETKQEEPKEIKEEDSEETEQEDSEETEQEDAEETEQEDAEEIEKEESTDSSAKCKKCCVKFTEMELLRSHYLLVHQKNCEGFLCLECGEAYKTVNSLSIHLRSHGIADTEAYLRKYKICEKPRILNIAIDKANVSDELKCPVCSEMFNNPSEHHQHLRSHGMAFLKRIKQM